MPPSLEERISLVSKLPISPSGGHVSHCRVQSIKEQVIGAGWKYQTCLCRVASGAPVWARASVPALLGGAVITKSNRKQWVTRLTGQWHCGRIWVLNLAVLTYSDCNILHKSQIFGYSYISCGIHQFPKTKPGIHIVANLFLSLSELGRFE